MRDRLGVAGVTGIAGMSLFALLALAGGGRRKRRALRAVLAGSLAMLSVIAGCGPGLSTQTSALATTSTVYFHATYGAGPSLTTGAAGQLVEERRTEPFGAAIDALHDGVVQAVDYRRDPVNALNKLTDPDTGWSYHGARWLAPDTAQWHTPDPPATAPDAKFMTTPWSLHPYQYVEQNPIVYWDPDGREPQGVACEAPSCALAVAINAKMARDDRLVSAAEALVGKLTWSGPSKPDPSSNWQISTKSTRLRNDTHGEYDTHNDFAKWVRGGPAPTESSVMNCWEAVLFAGYKSGVISKDWITSVQADATYAGKSDHSSNSYFDVLKKRLGFNHSAKLKPGIAVERGDLVFFDGLNHVAVATGKTIESGGVVKHEVISLWILPDRSNGHLNSQVQRTTIEDIQARVAARMDDPIKEVRVGANPW
jgi:RHS repeat-associated protein